MWTPPDVRLKELEERTATQEDVRRRTSEAEIIQEALQKKW